MVMRIKELREARGLAQNVLARDMGVLPSAVCNWECEVALPKARQLPLLAHILGVSVNELYDPAYLDSVS